MSRFRDGALLAVALGALAAAAPATASAKSCGQAKGVGNGAVVTGVKTTSGSCTAAKVTAKAFARTRVAPSGYTCKEKFTATMRASVTCRRPGRTVSFKVVWKGSMPLPAAPALPQT